jgi:hypothetical protein
MLDWRSVGWNNVKESLLVRETDSEGGSTESEGKDSREEEKKVSNDRIRLRFDRVPDAV